MSKKTVQQPSVTTIDPVFAQNVITYIAGQRASKQELLNTLNAVLANMLGVRRPDGYGDNGQRGWFQMVWEGGSRDSIGWPGTTVMIVIQPEGSVGVSARSKGSGFNSEAVTNIHGMRVEATCAIAKLLIDDLERGVKA